MSPATTLLSRLAIEYLDAQLPAIADRDLLRWVIDQARADAKQQAMERSAEEDAALEEWESRIPKAKQEVAAETQDAIPRRKAMDPLALRAKFDSLVASGKSTGCAVGYIASSHNVRSQDIYKLLQMQRPSKAGIPNQRLRFRGMSREDRIRERFQHFLSIGLPESKAITRTSQCIKGATAAEVRAWVTERQRKCFALLEHDKALDADATSVNPLALPPVGMEEGPIEPFVQPESLENREVEQASTTPDRKRFTAGSLSGLTREEQVKLCFERAQTQGAEKGWGDMQIMKTAVAYGRYFDPKLNTEEVRRVMGIAFEPLLKAPKNPNRAFGGKPVVARRVVERADYDSDEPGAGAFVKPAPSAVRVAERVVDASDMIPPGPGTFISWGGVPPDRWLECIERVSKGYTAVELEKYELVETGEGSGALMAAIQVISWWNRQPSINARLAAEEFTRRRYEQMPSGQGVRM